jgi:hypothetical protein
MGLGVPELMLIGAGTGLLTGGGLKGAVKGAALGGIGGGVGNMMKAGQALQGASAIPATSGAFEASMGLSGLPGMGTIESAGLGAIGGGSTLYNPEYFANVLGNPVYKGGEGLLSNLGGGILNGLPDYVTPQNMMGAANIISGVQPQQMQSAPAGGVSQGKTQGLNVDMGGARPISLRKREDF